MVRATSERPWRSFASRGSLRRTTKSLCGGRSSKGPRRAEQFPKFLRVPIAAQRSGIAYAVESPGTVPTPACRDSAYVCPVVRSADPLRGGEALARICQRPVGRRHRLGVEGIVMVRSALGSPAEHAGLRGVDFNTAALGDVIVAVNDKTVRRLSDLTRARTKRRRQDGPLDGAGGDRIRTETEVVDIDRVTLALGPFLGRPTSPGLGRQAQPTRQNVGHAAALRRRASQIGQRLIDSSLRWKGRTVVLWPLPCRRARSGISSSCRI
jgi:hypothetical protein